MGEGILLGREALIGVIIHYDLVEVGHPVGCILVGGAHVGHDDEGMKVDTAVRVLLLRVGESLEAHHDVLPAILGLHIGWGVAPELLYILTSLSAPACLESSTQSDDHHAAGGGFVLEVGHHVNVLQLLGHADGLLEVDAHAIHVTAVAAALEGHHLLRGVGGYAEHLVGGSAGVKGYTSVALELACAEGALLPLVIYTDTCIVLGIECDGCLRLCGESEKHQRSRK